VFLVDLVAGATAAFVFADVAVTVRRTAQDIDRAGPGRMPLAAAAAFEDLGTLVFGHHPLHLQEEIFFGGFTEWPIEKDHFDAGTLPFVQEQYLQGVVACQTIGRVDIQPIYGSGGYLIA